MCPTAPTKALSTASKDSSTGTPCSGSAVAVEYSQYPPDWPSPKGTIDLERHDLPHFSSSLEWWYLNAHLDVADVKTKKKKKSKKGSNDEHDNDSDEQHPGFALFATFFRKIIYYDEDTKEYVYAHVCSWAVMDLKTEKYYNVSLVDKRTPELLLKALELNPDMIQDTRLRRATVEMLLKGNIAYPDRLLKRDPLILGKNLTRLPDIGVEGSPTPWIPTRNDEADEEEEDDKTQKKSANKNSTKNKKSSCCCFGKNIANSIAGVPRLTLDYDGNTFSRNSDGSYNLFLEDKDVHHVKVDIRFVPQTDPIRNGIDGVVDGEGNVEDMFYYMLPHCKVQGTVVIPDEDDKESKLTKNQFFVIDDKTGEKTSPSVVKTHTHKVTGTGWYDHEFGRNKKTATGDEDADDEPVFDGSVVEVQKMSVKHKKEINLNPFKDSSWNWLSLQFDNGYQLCCSEFFIHSSMDHDQRANDTAKSMIALVDPDGQRHKIDAGDFTFSATGQEWVSMRTFRGYPVNWELTVPSMNIQLQLKATFAQQEFATVISKPAFWEGCIRATGVFHGKPVAGKGFVERNGFCSPKTLTLEHFFKNVSRETLKSVQNILPFNPSSDKFSELVSHKKNAHYTEFIDNQQFSKAMVEPIRCILDRGGKSWRSYAALACCDMVGGNSQLVSNWLALPELMHVGSLIVDDVEDRSDIRRGGPCSHIMYGEDVAINAGSFCYFLGQTCVYQADGASLQQKNDVYNLYFEAMRAAHCGQAMDIHGLDYMMPDVVENGGDLCRQRVIAIHRLKSAVPASSLAGMGCTLGGGSELQSKGLADYFEALGIAFQIVDDVLNLKGFRDGLKTMGEDITAGKVTYPIAKAMSRLEKEDRAKLWEIVSSRPEDTETIGEAVALIDKVDGIDDSYKEAKDIMEEAWHKLDPLVVDSMTKVNLRAFSWYVLDRTY
ncbi:Heterodimeric geranylgeranyl pyrophosphate synthase large subunit [Seminavis robusta]|uniref:Heterodimeric geranylgeranyl pyrophosphate synthase large subunit n=1 Tax=Seminavis robusta TaxID=568900 RepID=A0A9N8DQI8_9STRA|nr:Heterodimeric geranylgeranyl pyrophosphate synthase large subunit [Seminavis robusta]|eukprot:Sro283_g107680.1 Heterodimeric geranylgeranyl pyrophosphate synthase large subunit (940) ;mRNA; r:20595-23517